MLQKGQFRHGNDISSLDFVRLIHCFPCLHELTLNLLQNSLVNPKLLAWANIFGTFDFNATPLALPGTKVVVHIKPHKWSTWDPHRIAGFYTAPTMHHYRCYTCYIPKTRLERITDTVLYIPSNVPIPAFNHLRPMWRNFWGWKCLHKMAFFHQIPRIIIFY